MDESTREAQYSRLLQLRDAHGQESLGLMMNQAWFDDPRRLTFTFARYKFVSRMLDGCRNVLEVGCGDAFASRIVLQSVGALSVTDFDPVFLEDIRARQIDDWRYKRIFSHDLLAGPINAESYDGIFALDVLEHIRETDESTFIANMIAPLAVDGTVIIGMPSLESQTYASPLSKEGHVNCKSMPDLKATMQQHFTNVYMFCFNDEMLHVGYHKMAHYIVAVCCGKKD